MTPLILLLAFAATDPAAATTAAVPTPSKDVPIPAKIPSPPSEETTPTVTIRDGVKGDRIEEYRVGGRLTMIRVVPLHGKPYYLYDDNGDGRLDRSDIDRAGVRPVYWEIASW